jgi:hypothetical protein
MIDPHYALLFIVPLLFAAVWVGVLSLVARLGGWSRLAAAYRTREPFEGSRKRFASGSLLGGSLFGCPCDYSGSLTVGSNPEGLYIAVLPLFRPGHPPLFVPWQDVTAQVKKGWLRTTVILTFRQVPSVRLRVSLGLARWAVEDAGAAATYSLNLTDDQPHESHR